MSRTTTAANREEWRQWLEQNHATEREVWLIFHRKESGKPSITYRQSLEEALCYGWIDSLIQKIDDERYARKFNPRRPGSQWSELNRHLAARLVDEGRMTPAGLAAIRVPLPDAHLPPPRRLELALPDWLKAALMTSPVAWEFYNTLPASQRRICIGWISDAKRDDTRQRRVKEAIEKLERKERWGL